MPPERASLEMPRAIIGLLRLSSEEKIPFPGGRRWSRARRQTEAKRDAIQFNYSIAPQLCVAAAAAALMAAGRFVRSSGPRRPRLEPSKRRQKSAEMEKDTRQTNKQTPKEASLSDDDDDVRPP